MFPTQRPAKVLARAAGFGCNAQSFNPGVLLLTMRVKRRYLPDFETASLMLFGLLAAAAVQPARAQFGIGPTPSTRSVTATSATQAVTPRLPAASSASRPASGELGSSTNAKPATAPKAKP